MGISIYHAHEFIKTIKSMSMVYILSAPANSLVIPRRQSDEFKLISIILDYMLTSIHVIVLVQKDISGNRLEL